MLNYPLKSHRKKVVLPDECEEFAEFLGIIFGDGGITNPWQLVISLNSISDIYYAEYVRDLIEGLFRLVPVIRKRPSQNCLVLVITSSTIVDFVVSHGMTRGNKLKMRLSIPTWVLSNDRYLKKFVRGLIDTDGGLYTHNHKVSGKNYYNIGLCFANYDSQFLLTVAKIFEYFGVKPHIRKGYHHIYLYSVKAVLKYLEIFGSSNPRVYKKLEIWRGVRVVD